MKLVFSTIALILSGVFAGCASAPEPGLEAARRMILDGRAECVLVKDRHVHGEVMSEDAAEFLKAHGVTSGCTLPVPRILNRKRDGLCPLEQSVAGIDDPEQALAALKNKIESFRKNRN